MQWSTVPAYTVKGFLSDSVKSELCVFKKIPLCLVFYYIYMFLQTYVTLHETKLRESSKIEMGQCDCFHDSFSWCKIINQLFWLLMDPSWLNKGLNK